MVNGEQTVGSPEAWRQQRRRTLLGTAVIVCVLLGLLTWLLLHPSSPTSPARKVKNAIFGRRVTEAAEQFAQGRGEAGGGTGGQTGGPGSGQGQAGQPGNASQGSGQGSNAGGSGASGVGGQGTGVGGTSGSGSAGTGTADGQGVPGRGHGTPLTGPVSGPINPHEPENNPPEMPAPEARSIGWLDRFFGTQTRDNGPLRAGEGGTGSLPGSGNTNTAPSSPTNPAVAAEITESNAAAPGEMTLDEPPQPRTASRAAGATNALNDNFEQLLRQHRAGSGDVRISLMWSNRNDIDLHVVDPNGEEIFYGHRLARSGGLLDIDMNASPPFRVPAVENVFWPQRAAPAGEYKVYVNHYRQHDSVNLTPFRVRVLVRGRTTDIPGSIQFGEAKKLVYKFTLPAATRLQE